MSLTGIKKIWLLFTIFLMLFIINLLIPNSLPTQRMWMILELCSLIIAIYLLIKNGLPSKNKMILAAILSFLVSLSYQNGIAIFWSKMAFFGIMTFIAILAILSVFNKYPSQALPFINRGKYQPLMTISLGLLFGILLGIINLVLSQSSLTLNFNIYCLFITFSPAILEELMLRTLFYALCVYLLNGKITTRFTNLTCLFMMVIPHVLIHTPVLFIQYGLIAGLINTFIYIVLYGLPFALLQKKWDLTSAMLAHGIVDFIRFCFTGLPY